MLTRALRVLPLLSILLAAQPSQDPAALARKALDHVLAGQYADFLQMSTADVQKSLPEAEMAKLGALIKTYGALEKIGDPTALRSGPNSILVFPARFATQNINFRIIINASGQVSGFFQLPGGVNWQRPEYSKPDTFKEREVTVGEGEWKLPGTLTVPVGAGPFPAAVLVHGSGPNDRDETVGGAKVFKDLAEGLASRGIVVLRYEKRTMQYRARVASIAKLTVQEETVEDAVKALALLRSQPEVNGNKIFRDRSQPRRVRGAAHCRSRRQTGRNGADGRQCPAARRPPGGTGGVHGHQRRPARTVQGVAGQSQEARTGRRGFTRPRRLAGFLLARSERTTTPPPQPRNSAFPC